MTLSVDAAIDLYRTRSEHYLAKAGEDGFDVHDPSTGELLGRFAASTTEDVDAAVQRARAAFPAWREVPIRERAKLMKRAAQVLRDHAEEIAQLESLEVGKPYEISRGYDLVVCCESFEFFGSVIENEQGTFHAGGPIDSYTVREPYGVVAGIIPFNWPPIHAAAKLAPALAMGNVAVVKPPEQCPLAVLRIIELLSDVFPEGVINVVTGLGSQTGAALVGHPGIHRISFTGSPGAARAVLHAAADNFVGALLELGGKNPLLVFPDADLDTAIAGAIEGAFFNQGEACTAASRLLVHRSIAPEFTKRLVEAVAKLNVGHPLREGTHIGPMITAVHRARVEDYIAVGEAEGANVAFRGETPADLPNGHFVPPIVFTGVTPSMRIAQEEIFGPVTTVIEFDDFDEAIEIANGTDFALVAGVFTADPAIARRASSLLDAGVVFVNNYNRMFLGQSAFGGNRASGYGREHVAETLNEFARLKSVRTPSGLAPVPLWSGARA